MLSESALTPARLSHLTGDRLRFHSNGVPGSLVGEYIADDGASIVSIHTTLPEPATHQLVRELRRVSDLYRSLAYAVQHEGNVPLLGIGGAA